MKTLLLSISIILFQNVFYAQVPSLRVIDFNVREDFNIENETATVNPDKIKLFVGYKVNNIAIADSIFVQFMDANNSILLEIVGNYTAADGQYDMNIQNQVFRSARYETNVDITVSAVIYNQTQHVQFFVKDNNGGISNISDQRIR